MHVAAGARRYAELLADEGWALRERVAHVPEALYGSLDLSDREANQLRRLLAKLLGNLDG